MNPLQGGLSLISLLVSLALGLVLSAAVVALYLEAKHQYLLDDEAARLQENGRYAVNLLRRELLLAGFFGGVAGSALPPAPATGPGCGVAGRWPLGPLPPIDLQPDYRGGLPRTVSGGNLDCLPAAALQQGSDLLATRRVAGAATLANGVYSPGVSAVDNGHWYLRWREHSGDADWWQAGLVDAAEELAGSGAWYWRLYPRIFYVRRYSAEPADGIPALCAERLAPSGLLTQCLVEGVEYLLLELGIDEGGDGVPDYYLRHPTAAQLQWAVSARIHVLQRGLTPLQGYRDNRQYRLGQTTLDIAGDGYLRRVFSATVQLRNAAVRPVAG
ncbi:PilW family protein [Haliea sp. E1-2-M8]|uniref:PilW family protein n=1 Tax=Haliea sp. E1-2-M8 TaxID=3064706 RepID=UPI0027158A40|nr:PilW family protein [Haliea sp. E1-2-M8]MDO8862482.1 PilW family protein [Haliea sp. E1-2-M8]